MRIARLHKARKRGKLGKAMTTRIDTQRLEEVTRVLLMVSLHENATATASKVE
jgi:hypothetical protein